MGYYDGDDASWGACAPGYCNDDHELNDLLPLSFTAFVFYSTALFKYCVLFKTSTMSATIWSLLGSLLIYGQRILVYPHGFIENPRAVHEPSGYNIPFEDLRLTTPDRVTLACHLMLFSEFYTSFTSYTAKPDVSASSKDSSSTTALSLAGRATVVMFHGNAMNHGDVIDLAVQFLIMGCNVLTVSYRGYGHSTGKPSEGGLRIDSQTVLDHLLQHPTLSQVPIIIYGQSLGGAVAIDLVSRNPSSISALILENTFMSIPALVKGWPNPIGSLSFLCSQRWPSLDRMRSIAPDIPILMLSGDKDAVIPPPHMRGLWAASKVRGIQEDAEGRCSPFFFCGTARGGEKPSPEEVEEAALEEMTDIRSPATIWNGKNMFRYFSGTGHEDTYLAASYWTDVRTFIDQLGLAPPINDPDFDEIFTSTFSSESIFYRR